jgi:hypothetical protein
MDWRQFLKPILYISVLFFALFLLDFWRGKNQPLGLHEFISYVIMVIVLSIGWVGFDELKRGGHRKALRALKVCLIILFVIPAILLIARHRMHWNIAGWNFHDFYLFIPIYTLFAATFPFALYLNRHQKDSTSQPTVDDAN